MHQFVNFVGRKQSFEPYTYTEQKGWPASHIIDGDAISRSIKTKESNYFTWFFTSRAFGREEVSIRMSNFFDSSLFLFPKEEGYYYPRSN